MDAITQGDFSHPMGYQLGTIYYLGQKWWQIIWKE